MALSDGPRRTLQPTRLSIVGPSYLFTPVVWVSAGF